MHRIPLRTAVIAGSCAVALSFIAVPAYASGHGSGSGDDSASVVVWSLAGSQSHAADDSTTAADDDSADDSANDASDDSADDTADDNDSSDADDDGGADDSSLPAEAGKPELHLKDATLDPAVFTRKGVTVTVTGLTPRATYQPYWSTAAMGDSIGKPVKADKRGALEFTWKPGKAQAAGSYRVGLSGQDTDLDLRQGIEVKYGSDVTWRATDRHGRKVTLSASVDRHRASGADSAWRKVEVEFQKQVGTTWVTVRTVRTNGSGIASTTIASGVQTWRAVVDDSTTVFGDRTKGVRR